MSKQDNHFFFLKFENVFSIFAYPGYRLLQTTSCQNMNILYKKKKLCLYLFFQLKTLFDEEKRSDTLTNSLTQTDDTTTCKFVK